MFDRSFEPRNNGFMGSADSRPGLPSRWAGVGVKLPPALEHLAGPADGVVELPLDLAWSGAALDEEFSLETLRDQLAFASAYPDEAFSRYGARQELIAEVKAWALDWSTEIGLDMAEPESWSDDEDDQDAAWGE
jgi:hypothetical protein